MLSQEDNICFWTELILELCPQISRSHLTVYDTNPEVIYNLYLVQIVEGECQEQLSLRFHSIGTGYVLVEDMMSSHSAQFGVNHSITPQKGGQLKVLKIYNTDGIL